MKRKVLTIVIIFIMSVLLIVFYSIKAGGLFIPTVEFKISKDIDPFTGKETYSIHYYHWYNFEIIRYDFLYDLTKKQVDSLVASEKEINKLYKRKL